MLHTKSMKDIIYYFCIKYNGNWEKIYDAIKNREPITKDDLINVAPSKNNFMSIIDDNYPNNFKSIYMPPLCLFNSGNISLINEDDNIISLWSSLNSIKILKEQKLKKDYIYAVIYKSSDFKDVNELLGSGYKLILVAEKCNQKEYDFFKSVENCLLISEFDSSFSIDKDKEQIIERILLGVSKKSIILDSDINTFQNLNSLFKLEKRQMNVLNIMKFTNDEIKKYNITNLIY